MKLVIDDITLVPGQEESGLPAAILGHFKITAIIQSPDTAPFSGRAEKSRIVYRYRVLIELEDTEGERLLGRPGVSAWREELSSPPIKKSFAVRPVIIGSGPAGLFCALRLIEAGAEVDILERGSRVDARMKDIALLETKGILNAESNVLFGEGGAGAYSDGKLTTRIHRGEVRWVMERLADFGAPGSILYDAKPHIGTDRLQSILKNIRDRVEASGSRFNFSARVDDFVMHDGAIAGVSTSAGAELLSGAVVLAMGHSARDTYELLERRGVALEKKGFAVGLRVEHPREMIDEIQFGKRPSERGLPAADYSLAWNNPASGRGVYTFCMCPGGSVINSSSEEGRLCLNGMSNSLRAGRSSNAALVVSVGPGDLPGGVLAGIEFQRQIEEAAFLAGGGGFIAPAQRVSSFLRGKLDASLPAASYRPGCVPARLDELLPAWIIEEIKNALPHFNRKMAGFVGDEALLLGVESRTSSPVRVLRGDDYQSVSVRGLFPAGEGAGYAGGIVSSAVDGVRVADAIISIWGR